MFKINGHSISEIMTCPPELKGLSVNYLSPKPTSSTYEMSNGESMHKSHNSCLSNNPFYANLLSLKWRELETMLCKSALSKSRNRRH